MSMYSGLTRAKPGEKLKDGTVCLGGELLKEGKLHVIGLETGEDTPVKTDERFDVDLNKLVNNEVARQELIRAGQEADYQDLTDYPRSRGEAEHRLIEVKRKLSDFLVPGLPLEHSQRLYDQAVAADLEKRARDLAREKLKSEEQPKEKQPEAPKTPQA